MFPVAVAWLAASAAHAETYTLQPAKSALFVVVRNDSSSLAGGFGHDHAISAESFSGTVTWDTADASKCAVNITFPISALAVDPPGLRSRAGLDDHDPGSNRKSIASNMTAKRQLWADKFPQISYTATTCDGTSGTVNVKGTLSIRGVGKAITVPMKVTVTDTSFAASGSFTLNHSDFGFDPFSNALGALRNLNRLDFVVDVKGSVTP